MLIKIKTLSLVCKENGEFIPKKKVDQIKIIIKKIMKYKDLIINCEKIYEIITPHHKIKTKKCSN